MKYIGSEAEEALHIYLSMIRLIAVSRGYYTPAVSMQLYKIDILLLVVNN